MVCVLAPCDWASEFRYLVNPARQAEATAAARKGAARQATATGRDHRIHHQAGDCHAIDGFDLWGKAVQLMLASMCRGECKTRQRVEAISRSCANSSA